MELLIRLGDLRLELSERNYIEPESLICNESLRQMAIMLPADIGRLRQIDGIDDDFIEDYAELFIEIIRSYVAEEEITKKPQLSRLTLEIASKANRNESISNISRSLHLSKNIIASHIIEALKSGVKINRNTLVSDDIYCEVHEYIIQNPYAPLREIRRNLGSHIDLADLKICTCFAREQVGQENPQTL